MTIVTHLQFYLFAVNFDSFNHKVDADGGALSRGKESLREPTHETGFAYAGVTDQHHFEKEFVIIHDDIVSILLARQMIGSERY